MAVKNHRWLLSLPPFRAFSPTISCIGGKYSRWLACRDSSTVFSNICMVTSAP